MEIEIRELAASEHMLFQPHMGRHRAESGRGDIHFMPFAPDDPDGPQGVSAEKLALTLADPGWHRCWIALRESDNNEPISARVIGHVDLKGHGLRAANHRCELGIGIERAYRGGGLGRRLMQAAIDFCVSAPSLEWLDLRVFAHNQKARALYQQLGFKEHGAYVDLVRIEGEPMDDVLMTLSVTNPPKG